MTFKLLYLILTLLILSPWTNASIVFREQVQSHSEGKSEISHDRVAPWIQQFEDDISPLVQNQGGDLSIVIDWDSQRVNSEAKRIGREYVVVIYSGLITYQEVSDTMLKLILCHEIGHHLGGDPKASRTGWSASEGQADYFSTLKCAKELADINYENIKNEFEKLAQFYARIERSSNFPNLENMDSTQVERTFFGYPSPQCRLDTLIAGWENKSRPVCWFRE